MRKLMVLGASGFLGRYFIQSALHCDTNKRFDHIVAVGARDPAPGSQGDLAGGAAAVEFVRLDLSEREPLRALLAAQNPTHIVNFVGTLNSVASMADALRLNLGVATNLLEKASELGLQAPRVLLIGSAAEYGDTSTMPLGETSAMRPLTYYGISKALQTQAALSFHRAFQVPVVVARPFNILGRGMPETLAIGRFVKEIKATPQGGVLKVGNLEARRDFLHVADTADALFLLMCDGIPGRVYPVCSGASVPLHRILMFLIEQSGRAITVEKAAQLLRAGDVAESVGDPSLLKSQFGWEPYRDIFAELTAMIR